MNPRIQVTSTAPSVRLIRGAATALAVLIVAAGCSSVPETSPALLEAREFYDTTKANENVLRYASGTLDEAGKTLQRAAEAETLEDMNSLAYVAKTQTETAAKLAEAKEAEERIDELSTIKDRVQLEAREADLAAARQQLEELEAKRTARGLVITLGSVLFETGKSSLLPGAMEPIDRVAAYMLDNPDSTALIEGHTDSTGSDATNRRLSQDRANAVGFALQTRGVSPSRIRAVGLASSRPVATNDTAAGRQQNRRVEIVLQ